MIILTRYIDPKDQFNTSKYYKIISLQEIAFNYITKYYFYRYFSQFEKIET
jgi:hypothetical protein